MKKIISHLLLLLVAVVALASCKKEEEDFRFRPQTQIIFNDNIENITADYSVAGNIVLKITATGASSVTVTNLTGGPKVLGTLPIGADGSATLTVRTNTIRNTGTVTAATGTTAAARNAATYSLKVDATQADGTLATRYFSAVVVQ
jgi:uncharacterized lipoprotein YajG